MSDAPLVQFTVDGRQLSAPKGSNLLDAMLAAGIDISYFCYHPGLAVVAVCRQCLVGLKSSPKLVPACQTPVAPGMEVDSSSARVLEARRQMLEFTLVNHPIDCPICDKAGECSLQKQYFEWDGNTSRIDHPKVRKGKKVDLGPRIVLDQERCILCTRCVRFCAEVAKDPQLTIANRGNRSILTTAPGHKLDSAYSLNTVDICPVGALTDKDFRFQIRVWNLASTQSVCNGCATGCLCEIHHHRNRIYRMVPRRTRDVNLNWMCDFGRYTYKAQAKDRLTLPLIGGKEASWEDALGRLGDGLGGLLESARGAVGMVIGADATSEDCFVAARLARDFLKLERVYLGAEPNGDGDKILRAADPNPNRAGVQLCAKGPLRSAEALAAELAQGELKALWVVGDRLYLPELAQERLGALQLLVVQATHPSPLTRKAHVVLPACMWQEVDGTMINRENKVQRLRAAVRAPEATRPHWEILVRAARRLGLTLEHSGPRAIFEAMKQELPELAQADWGGELPPVQLRFAGSRG
jgi:NADH-quinone oxidoreductase subunit G